MKTRDPRWYDLFDMRPTRRDFLRVGGGVAGLVALGSLPACGRGTRVPLAETPFRLGVASGDPAPNGVVLWARLAREVLMEVGVHDDPVSVDWEVSEQESFAQITQWGSTLALPELGHSVHVEVEGLDPARTYFYRLRAGGHRSPVGRTRTAPAPGASPDRLRFAFASCQNYEHGLFTAYRHMAEEDLDLIVHLGDYIYERTFGRSDVRQHERSETTDNESGEVRTLEGYRARYTTYRADPDLQAAHAAAPWVVTWDDHEVENNYAGGVSGDGEPREDFLLRRAAAYQAFYEFMPLRRSSVPAGPEMRLYRRLRFGDLLEMSVLDTRQYRSDQPCGDGARPTCAEHVAPERSLLGHEQREWLFRGLAASEARWNVLAQQVMVARLRGVTEAGDETWSMDKWDGYPGERRALIELLARPRVTNPVVLTGDIHSSWVADLRRDFEDESSAVVGTELVGTSISSGGDGQEMSPGAERALSLNPHLKFYDGRRGYVTATVTPERWTSAFRVVPVVTQPGGAVETRAAFVVEDGRPGAVEA